MAHCLTQPRQGTVRPRCEYRCSVSPRQRAMSLSHSNGNTAAGGHERSKGPVCGFRLGRRQPRRLLSRECDHPICMRACVGAGDFSRCFLVGGFRGSSAGDFWWWCCRISFDSVCLAVESESRGSLSVSE